MFSGMKKWPVKFITMLLLFSTAVSAESTLALSQQEQSYLKSIDAIRLCTDPHWMPYEGIDEHGHHSGIMSDFHKLWAEKIGKPIVLQPTDSWQQSLQYLQQRRCDIVSSAQDVQARRDYMAVTKPFIFYPLAIATRPDNPFIINLAQVADRRFAMVKGHAGVEMVRERCPGIDIVTADSVRVGLEQVETGKVFAFIDTIPSINYQTLKYGVSDIKINGVLDLQYAVSVGVRNDHPELLSIFNKAITATSDEDRQHILNKWLAIKFHDQSDYLRLWQILVAISVVMMLLAYRYFVVNHHNHKLVHLNKKLEHMSKNDQLTGIPNRYYLHQIFQNEVARVERYQHAFAVILLDIDLFKDINDTFGHLAGDEVIKHVASLLSTHIRANDQLGRWGGEEFLILCPETDSPGAGQQAERLRGLIQALEFTEDDIRVTASFGVTCYRSGESMEDCLKRADDAMYQAKRNGRNKTVVL